MMLLDTNVLLYAAESGSLYRDCAREQPHPSPIASVTDRDRKRS